MNLLTNYIIRNFWYAFFPIFSALALIVSIAFFIQISEQTSYLKISFAEIMQLYLYYTPEILLYTLPISFFAASVISLGKLSFDLELIVIFALRGNINMIIKALSILAVLITMTLLVIGLWLKPKAMLKAKEMIYNKEDTSQLNLQPSEYGQKFGDWLLHVENKIEENSYGNIVLFSKQKESELFIGAEKGTISQKGGYFNLALEDGKTYNISEERIQQIKFTQMKVNKPSSIAKLSYTNIVEFWKSWIKKRNARDFSAAILTALFPVLSLLMIVSMGVLNPRFEKNRSSMYVIMLSTLYYAITYGLGERFPYYSIAIVPAVWLSLSYFIYKLRIKGRY